MMISPKEVLVIFKTHLDIGFTNYAENIVSDYLNTYIPKAIEVGYATKDSDSPFIWTVGSWMIWKALQEDNSGAVRQAVADGILNWHGLPFTTHTELMNETLFEFGLDISAKLDQTFGRKTIAAKMTDVPGHTIGMVPHLCKRSIKFLHIGVNPATPLPPVPPLFRWKCDADEVIVMYQGAYGEEQAFGDFVIHFAHTNDNHGPQSAEEIAEIYRKLRAKYPGADVKAATLNDVAERVCQIKDIPVYDKEIGDTWIHGSATDPEKMSRYRKLLRHIEKHGVDLPELADNLLLLPEHTCGMDIKTFFKNTTAFEWDELAQCKTDADYQTMERSWQEQRNYVLQAEKLLHVTPDYPVQKPDLTGWVEINPPKETPFEISWQLFDQSDYAIYQTDYMRLTPENQWWALSDFTKPGLPEYQGGIFPAAVRKAYACGDKKIYELDFDDEVKKAHGLPCFYAEISDGSIEIKWFGKKASRLPQAFWLKLKNCKEDWQLNKLGQWISADTIAGSPLISAVDRGIRNEEIEIQTLDTALVAPYGRKLLRYKKDSQCQDLYFNLYNNIWNTNFPIWYSDDARFRFRITNRKEQAFSSSTK